MAADFGDKREWFRQKRFGLLIHWGIYAIPGWHEQHQWRGRVPWDEYVKLADRWNPVRFDPDAYLDLAAEVGIQTGEPVEFAVARTDHVSIMAR